MAAVGTVKNKNMNPPLMSTSLKAPETKPLTPKDISERVNTAKGTRVFPRYWDKKNNQFNPNAQYHLAIPSQGNDWLKDYNIGSKLHLGGAKTSHPVLSQEGIYNVAKITPDGYYYLQYNPDTQKMLQGRANQAAKERMRQDLNRKGIKDKNPQEYIKRKKVESIEKGITDAQKKILAERKAEREDKKKNKENLKKGLSRVSSGIHTGGEVAKILASLFGLF